MTRCPGIAAMIFPRFRKRRASSTLATLFTQALPRQADMAFSVNCCRVEFRRPRPLIRSR
jgi:hypothetical protein